MSGHSKWANIKYRKAAVDARKGLVFSKLSRAILIAARRGGRDPEVNFDLKTALTKAREFGLPKENIQRAIARGVGEVDGVLMEELVYEGYGPGGSGFIVEAVSENRNRTTSDVRHLFSKFKGALGTAGSVSWKFKKKGLLVVPSNRAGKSVSEDEVLDLAAQIGADDMKAVRDGFEIVTPLEEFSRSRMEIEKKGYPIQLAELTLIAAVQVPIGGETARQVFDLVLELQDLEDVQNVTTDADLPDELFSQAA